MPRLASLACAFTALVLIAACAAGPATSAPGASSPVAADEPRDALPPQTLSRGECGLFLFELRDPNAFVLFESETRRQVKLLEDGRMLELGVSPQSAGMIPGEQFRRVYLDQARNVTYTLSGRIGGETASGQRLEDVILRTRSLGGTERVTPLGGVRRCMARAPAAG